MLNGRGILPFFTREAVFVLTERLFLSTTAYALSRF